MAERKFGGVVFPIRLLHRDTMVEPVTGQAGRVRHPLHRVEHYAGMLGWPDLA